MIARVVCFDLYGTLLDYHALEGAVAEHGIPLPDQFVAAWRRKQIEYTWLASLAQSYRDFDELTANALEQVSAQMGLGLDLVTRAALVDAWRALPVFPDVMAALRALAQHGVPLAVLTNGTSYSANNALANAGLRAQFSELLSVERVRVYKPDPRAYAMATERFSCAPREVVFVSSNGWDAYGATRFGFRVAWVNRNDHSPETLGATAEATIGSLADLEPFVTGSLAAAR